MIQKTSNIINQIELLYFQEKFNEKTNLNDGTDSAEEESELKTAKKRKYISIFIIRKNKFFKNKIFG